MYPTREEYILIAFTSTITFSVYLRFSKPVKTNYMYALMEKMKLVSHRNSGVNTAVASEKNINIEQHDHTGCL